MSIQRFLLHRCCRYLPARRSRILRLLPLEASCRTYVQLIAAQFPVEITNRLESHGQEWCIHPDVDMPSRADDEISCGTPSHRTIMSFLCPSVHLHNRSRGTRDAGIHVPDEFPA